MRQGPGPVIQDEKSHLEKLLPKFENLRRSFRSHPEFPPQESFNAADLLTGADVAKAIQ